MITAKKSLVQQYDHIYSGDPAIDGDAKGLKEAIRLYQETGDESHLPLIDGAKPTRWKLQQLRGVNRRRIQELVAENKTERNALPLVVLLESCRCALVGVSGSYDEEGAELKIEREYDSSVGSAVVSRRTLDTLIETDQGLVEELGMRAFAEAFISPLSPRGSE